MPQPSVSEIIDALAGIMIFSSDDPPSNVQAIKLILASYLEYNEGVVHRVIARLDEVLGPPSPITFQEVRDLWL